METILSCRPPRSVARSVRRIVIAGIGAMISVMPAFAANWIWIGAAGNNSWNNSGNWSPTSPPMNDGTADIFFNGTSRLTPDLTLPWSVRSVTFQNGAGAFNLFSIAGNTLTIGAGGITNSDSDAQIIQHALTLSAAQTWRASAGLLRVDGPVSTGGNLLTIESALNRQVNFNGSITGGGGLVKTGLGALLLSNSQTGAGPISVSAGRLVLSNVQIAGPLHIGDGAGADIDTVSQTASSQISSSATVNVFSTGFWDMSAVSVSQTITALNVVSTGVGGGGLVRLNAGNLTILGDLAMTGGSIESPINGLLEVLGSVTSNAAVVSATISSPLSLNAGTKLFTVADSAGIVDDLNLSLVVSSGGINKMGPGTLTLSGASSNSFIGMTTVREGTLRLNKTLGANAISTSLVVGDGSGGTVIVENGGQIADTADVSVQSLAQFSLRSGSETIGSLTVNGGTSSNSLGTTLVITGALSMSGGLIEGGSLALGTSVTTNPAAAPASITSAILLGSVTRTITVGDGTAESDLDMSGTISGAASLVKAGEGVLAMTGSLPNTNTTVVAVQAGILSLSKNVLNGAVIGPLTIGDGAGGANADVVRLDANNQIADSVVPVIASSGRLDLNHFSETIGGLTLTGSTVTTGVGVLTLGGDLVANTSSAAATIGGNVNLGGGARTFTVANGAALVDLDISAALSNGTISKSGAGTLRLAGTSNFGGFTLIAGTLAVANNSAAGTGTLAIGGGTIQADGVARTLANPVTLGGDFTVGGSVSLTLSGPLTLTGDRTVTISNTALTSFSGALGEDAPGRAFTKGGAGTLVLGTGVTHTYTGPTMVNEGTLIVNGSIGGSAVIVASGATISGNGTTGALTIASGGNIAPGISPDVLRTGNLSLTTGAIYSLELQSQTALDQISVTGSVSLGGATLQGSLIGGFATAANDLFFVILNDGTDPVSGAFAGVAQGQQFIISGQPFTMSYTGNFTGTLITSSSTGGNDVVLIAVPEPASALMLCLAAAMLAPFRRSRRS